MTTTSPEVQASQQPTDAKVGPGRPASDRPHSPAEPPPQAMLHLALSLGWQVAYIFHVACGITRTQQAEGPGDEESGATPEPTATQPDVLDLSPAQELELRVGQMKGSLRKLNSTSQLPVGGAPVVSELPDVGALDEKHRTPDNVREFHHKLLSALTEMDGHLAKAYRLGQSLGDLTLRPSRDPAALGNVRPGRMDDVEGWLRDLKSLLAAHAATTVLGSVGHWQNWVLQNVDGGNQAQPQRPLLDKILFRHSPQPNKSERVENSAIVARALAQQGSRWRSLLTGEKLATDTLSSDDYVQAGTALLRRLRGLTANFLKQYWFGLLLLLAVVGGVIAMAFVLTEEAATGVTSFAAVLGGLGISAKAIKETLAKAASYLQDTLWEAQLDQACVKGVTVLPFGDSIDVEAAKLRGLRARWKARKLRRLRQSSIRTAVAVEAKPL